MGSTAQRRISSLNRFAENSFVWTKSKLVFRIPPSSEASEALKLINSPARVNSAFLQSAHFVPPENGKV